MPTDQANKLGGNVSVSLDVLKKWQRDMDACQKVIWLAGGFDPAYCKDAQACIKQMADHIEQPREMVLVSGGGLKVHRYKVQQMLSEKGNTIGYDPYGPEIVMADVYDADITRLQADRDQYCRMYNSASGALCAIGEVLGVDEDDQSTQESLEAITRLQAEVTGLRKEVRRQIALNKQEREMKDLARHQRDDLQSELTRAREVIGALAKGFNTLEQEGGKYRINMSFGSRDDAWSAYTALSQFNARARQSAPASSTTEK